MKLRTGFDDTNDVVSKNTGLTCKDPSLTRQSEAEDADINTIVRRFNLTGQLPTNIRVPLQEDFVDALTFQEAHNAIINAQQSFMAMPAEVRQRFDHNPAAFVEFCSNADNLPEMRQLGLAVSAIEPQQEKPNAKGQTGEDRPGVPSG